MQMSQDLGFSEAVFGLGAGVFFLGYFLFEVPSNLLMHRIGARIWIARIMITWGLLSAMFMFVETPTGFVLRFLLGLAEAGFYPGVILYLTYWYPAQRRAKIIALFMSAIPVAGIFGNPLSGWIMEAFHGAHGLQGWQWMFLIEALPVLIGIVTVMYLDNGIDRAKWLSDEEKRLLTREIEADQKQPARSAFAARSLRRQARLVDVPDLLHFRGRPVRADLLDAHAGQVHRRERRVQDRAAQRHPLPVRHRGHEPAGPGADRRRGALAPRAGAGGRHRFAATASFADNTAMSLLFLSLAAGLRPLLWSLPTAFLSGTAAAAGIAIVNSVGNLAGFVSPYMVGYLKDLTVDAVRHVRAGRAAGRT